MFIKNGNHLYNLDHVTDIVIDDEHPFGCDPYYYLKAFTNELNKNEAWFDFGIYHTYEHAEYALNDLFIAIGTVQIWNVISDEEISNNLGENLRK